MSPIDTKRLCIAAVDERNKVCANIPTKEGLIEAFNTFRHEVLMKYPYISAAVLLLWSFYPKFPFQVLWFVLYVVPRSVILGLLTCLGFERGGVRSDSIASRYQSQQYGGQTLSGGFFSRSQSYGAIAQDGSNGPIATEQPHPIRGMFWRFMGWVLLYGSLVVLLKYGGSS